jgi:hypothetical protein
MVRNADGRTRKVAGHAPAVSGSEFERHVLDILASWNVHVVAGHEIKTPSRAYSPDFALWVPEASDLGQPILVEATTEQSAPQIQRKAERLADLMRSTGSRTAIIVTNDPHHITGMASLEPQIFVLSAAALENIEGRSFAQSLRAIRNAAAHSGTGRYW